MRLLDEYESYPAYMRDFSAYMQSDSKRVAFQSQEERLFPFSCRCGRVPEWERKRPRPGEEARPFPRFPLLSGAVGAT